MRKTHIIVMHGIGFHEEGSGSAGIRAALKALTPDTSSIVVREVYWGRDADKVVDRNWVAGRVEAAWRLMSLAFLDVWNPRAHLPETTQQIQTWFCFVPIATVYLLSSLCVSLSAIHWIWGRTVVNWSEIASLALVSLAFVALMFAADLLPLSLAAVRQKLRCFFLVLSFPLAFLLQFLPTAVVLISSFLIVAAGTLVVSAMPDVFHPSFVVQVHNGAAIPEGSFHDFELLGTSTVGGITGILLLSLAIAIGARVAAPLSAACKFLADVALYLGDSSWSGGIRKKLSDALDASVDDGAGHTIICAHSLGTVIAVDVLRARNGEQRAVTLVTGGSPLARWLSPYFPSLYPSCRRIELELKRAMSFHWINVYRSADPVGGRLGLDPESECDVSGRKYGGLWRLSAHLNYWNDPSIALAAFERVQRNAS